MTGLPPLQLYNPTINFRLDPFEPGFLRSTKASEATVSVHAQEIRNQNRLQRQAIADGRVIIQSDISFQHGIIGRGGTIMAGRTTVTSVADTKPLSISEERTPLEHGAVQAMGSPPPSDTRGAPPPETDLQVEMELDRQRLSLEQELNRLKSQLVEDPGQYPANLEPLFDNTTNRPIGDIETQRSIQKLNRDIRALNRAEILAKLNIEQNVPALQTPATDSTANLNLLA
ncbi:hypothetical protein ACFL54_06185 [Planctomycetota bacterium]